MIVAELPDQIEEVGLRAFLLCRECGGEYSAHAGDYFAADPEREVTCCGEPCVLVKRRVTLEEVEL